MSNSTDNYLILGLKGSGKTTYFSLMAQHLQDVANRTEYLRFRFLPTIIINKVTKEESQEEITSDFISDCISRLDNQRWPRKTEDYEVGYSFELIKYFTIFKQPILKNYFYKTAIIDYHDYPGEAFSIAFGGENNPTPSFQEAAKKMKDQIKSAAGIFLLLDTDEMFNNINTSLLKQTLTGLFRVINDSNPNIKLAVIFNKLELFGNIDQDVNQLKYQFRRDYGGAFAYLPHSYNFFNVYTLGTVITPPSGEPIPPIRRTPKNILEPVKWMIGF